MGTVLTVILAAIEALAGPAVSAIQAIITAWNDFHQNGYITPEALILDATNVFIKVAPLVNNVQTQIALISQALQEANATLPATVATLVAASVVHKGLPAVS
jgi:hypothetical protein